MHSWRHRDGYNRSGRLISIPCERRLGPGTEGGIMLIRQGWRHQQGKKTWVEVLGKGG